jgi:predicted kinase
LARGETVVFDATNLQERRREVLYGLAERAGAVLAIVSAYAPEDVIRARLAQRMQSRTPGDVSDANWCVYLKLRPGTDPIRRPHIVANTVAVPDAVVRLVRRQVEAPASQSSPRC